MGSGAKPISIYHFSSELNQIAKIHHQDDNSPRRKGSFKQSGRAVNSSRKIKNLKLATSIDLPKLPLRLGALPSLTVNGLGRLAVTMCLGRIGGKMLATWFSSNEK